MEAPMFAFGFFLLLISIREFYCVEVDMRIGNKRTVLDRLDGTCGGDKNMKITFVANSMKAQGKKIVMNATFHVLEDILDDTGITIAITRCKVRENPDTCENFHTFNTNQYCHLISTKSPLWSPFFDQITPPWKCPLMKGDYVVENAVFDVSSFLLFPVQGWFWRVTAEQRDLKTKEKIFCLITDTQVTTMERLNVLYEKNWTRLVTAQLKRFEKAVVDAGKTDGSSRFSSNSSWTYGGALLYSVTLLTTVGYSRLTPKTILGKLVTIIYAIFGVPLMLVLLSELGSMFAGGATKGYRKLCCKHKKSRSKNDAHSSVGYHKAPSSPSGKHYYKNNEDSASIQLSSCHTTPNHHGATTPVKHPMCYSNPQPYLEYHHVHHQEIPKRAMLATVRSGRSRGGCRQGPVKQMLVDPSLCPQHCHGPPIVKNCAYGGTMIMASDIEEGEEGEDNELGGCAHATPSRIPLIWKQTQEDTHCRHLQSINAKTSDSPPVPTSLIVFLLVSYICAGAAALVTTSGWNFLEAVYFCFLALTTIGIGDKLPQSSDLYTQLQLLTCCVYLFVGLVLIAMCFSLVQDEITNKFRQLAGNIGYFRQ